jgi:hypothetical protein
MHAAAKYKRFNKLRDLKSGKTVSQKSKKRNSEGDVTLTPSKRSKSVEATPKKRRDSMPDMQEVTVEHETPVIKRTMMGPTPQKDGKVLGIFDLLPSETPSKLRAVFGNVENLLRTPSKSNGLFKDDASVEERARGSRTPTSSGKRFLLDSFVTPRKRKIEEEGTPSSSTKRLATPLFLRRDTFALSTVQEDPHSPEMVLPWKRRSFGRSLSGMISDLRKQEDEEGDDEWEAIHAMEEDMAPPKPTTSGVPKIFVQDSQRNVELDAEGFVPSDVEEADTEVLPQLDRNGQPRKPYKKKGLKRQTRRVISKFDVWRRCSTRILIATVRPVTLQAPEAVAPAEHSEDDEDEQVEPIPETQVVTETTTSVEVVDDDANLYSDDPDLSDGYGFDDMLDAIKPTESISKDKKDKEKEKKKQKSKDGVESTKKSTTKKVKPQAHANFVKLKIKNQNTKAKGKGRFGRNKR